MSDIREWCREDLADGARCHEPAEFILWGKLLKPEALGPRCYDHAAKHVGHSALGNPAWAIFDLRKVAQATLDPVTRVVEERAALEAERDEALAETKRVILDSGQVITRVRKRAEAAEAQVRLLTEALSLAREHGLCPADQMCDPPRPQDSDCAGCIATLAAFDAALASPSRDSAEREETDE